MTHAKRPKALVKAAKATPTPSSPPRDRIAQFDEVVALIRDTRRELGRAVDLHLIEPYWKIGALIVRRIESDGWGKGTGSELAAHLARTQPGGRGSSPPNLWRMRQFYETYQATPKLAALTRELPWSSNLHIMSGAKSDEEREFYLRMAVPMRWNVREVARQIDAAALEQAVVAPPRLSTVLRDRRALVREQGRRGRRVSPGADRLADARRGVPDGAAAKGDPAREAARVLRDDNG